MITLEEPKEEVKHGQLPAACFAGTIIILVMIIIWRVLWHS